MDRRVFHACFLKGDPMRLDKVLSSQGTASRKDVKKIIKKGRVTVDGEIIKDSAFQLNPEKSVILIDGQKLDYSEHVYYMMNKPQGVLSASRDPKRETVVSLLPDEWKRDGLFPAGRLDADTTGFVLITDDGDFAHRILSPKNHVWKTYLVSLEHPITVEERDIIEGGMTLEDGTECRNSHMAPVPEKECQVYLAICEGKYHQVKRMFAVVGNNVTALKRVAMGGVKLDKSLKPGESRPLTATEVAQIEENEDFLLSF